MRTKILFAVALATALATHADRAAAHGGGGDIALFNTGGQTDVGFAVLDDDDINQELFDPADSVFQAVLVPVNRAPVLPYDFGSSEPGYDANEAVATLPGQFNSGLPSGATVSWSTHAIWHWDGAGAVDFQPTTGVSGGYAAPTTGTTDSQGGFHLHPTFGLGRDDLGPLAEGVYLTELTVTVDGLDPSDPFWLVSLVDGAVNGAADAIAAEELAVEIGAAAREYLSGASPDAVVGGTDYAFYGDAVRFAESLAVPEPSSLLLAALVCVGAARRR